MKWTVDKEIVKKERMKLDAKIAWTERQLRLDLLEFCADERAFYSTYSYYPEHLAMLIKKCEKEVSAAKERRRKYIWISNALHHAVDDADLQVRLHNIFPNAKEQRMFYSNGGGLSDMSGYYAFYPVYGVEFQ